VSWGLRENGEAGSPVQPLVFPRFRRGREMIGKRSAAKKGRGGAAVFAPQQYLSPASEPARANRRKWGGSRKCEQELERPRLQWG